MSPLLDRRTTLKDALSMIIDAEVVAGIVVDRDGGVLGLVTAESIGAAMRDGVVSEAAIRNEPPDEAVDPDPEPGPAMTDDEAAGAGETSSRG
jgi:CBS domain containing-hemolysin-like protein